MRLNHPCAILTFILGSCGITLAMQAAPCHKAGPNTPGATVNQYFVDGATDPVAGPARPRFDSSLVCVIKAADGDLTVSVACREDAVATKEDDQTDPTKRLTIVDPPPQNVNCCHPVEFEGKSKMRILWQIHDPQPGDTSLAQVGEMEDPAKTEFIATADNCGTPITKSKRVEMFVKLECTSVAPAAPVCTLTGFVRTVDEGVPGAVTPIGPAVDLLGHRQRFLDFFKTAQYLRQAALKVINRAKVKCDAPPATKPPGGIRLANAEGSMDVQKQKLMDSIEPVTSD